MSQVTPEHVAGLVVGEGCFYTESGRDKKYRSGWRIRPAFCLEMRSDDREVLEEVKDHLNCGSIYDLDFGRYRSYESRGWRPHVKYRVSNITDLHGKVVPFFRKHQLFGRKRTAFEIFEQLVEMMYSREHLNPEGLGRAKELAEQLTKHNKKG
jgi:hypothetical protein